MLFERLLRYGVPVALVSVVLACRLQLNPLLHDASPFMFFVVPVLVSAWLFGFGSGLLAVLLSAIAVDYFYLEPLRTLMLASRMEALQSIPFLLLGTTISMITARMRSALRMASESAARARREESRHRATWEHAEIGIERLDEQGRLVDANPALCRMLGRSAAELLGKTHPELTYEDDREDERRLLEQLERREIPSYKIDMRYLGGDGRPLWVRVTSSLAPEGAGFHRIVLVEDFSARVLAEQALRRSEEWFRTAVESMLDGFAILSAVRDGEGAIVDFRFEYINNAGAQMNGYSPEQHIGVGLLELLPAHRDSELFEEYVRITQTGGNFRADAIGYEDVYGSGDRLKRVFDIEAAKLGDGFAVIWRDRTASELAKEDLRRNEERFRVAQDLSLDAFTILTAVRDAEGAIVDFRWVYVNPQAGRILRQPPEQLVGRQLLEVLPGNRTESELFARYVQVVETGRPHDIEVPYEAEGIRGWYRNMSVKLDDGIAIYFSDISQRKRDEAALRESEERYRSLFESISEAFVVKELITDEQGRDDFRFLLHNPGFVAQSGLQDVIGRTMREVMPDMEPVWIEQFARVVRTGEPVQFENRVASLDRWFDVSATRLGNGSSRKIAILFTDITEVRRAQDELRRANERLLIADQRKDEFLAMLAHELRNPLAPVRYAVQLMNAYCDTGCVSHQRLIAQREIIERQIGHMAHLIDDLLDVARITRGKIELRRELLDLNSAIRHCIDSCRQALEFKHQQLIVELPEEPLWIEGDRTRLEQVLCNLLGNAIKYSPARRRIWISAGTECAEGREMALVRLRDEGDGISPELLPHVFELFTQGERSLDRAQGGLGIGLTMVSNLIQMHGGSVTAASGGIGLGSEFAVRLPLSVAMESRPEESVHFRPSAAARPLRILAVDDVVDTAESLAELLTIWGHLSRAAFDGESALLAAREWDPEVILLDLGMPGMDGYEVARRIRAESHGRGVWIVALTGYGQENDRARAQEAGFNDHLVKPVDLNDLLGALERAAEQRQPRATTTRSGASEVTGFMNEA